MKDSKMDAPASEEARADRDWNAGDGTMEVTGAGTMNRTGASNAPEMALDMIRTAQRTSADPDDGDATALAEYRQPYIDDGSILGSMPVPNGTDADDPDAPDLSLLLDKLGERLAFERQGVRLYECLIGKLKLLGPTPGGPTVKELEHILKEEGKHFQFLQQAIVRCGGDPTVQTPCANVAGVLSQGVVQIVADPRTTLVQSLEAMLNAELVDNDGWAMLRDLVDVLGVNELADKIEEAEENELDHLEKVRGWLSNLVLGEFPDEDGDEADGEEDAEVEEESDEEALAEDGPVAGGKKPLKSATPKAQAKKAVAGKASQEEAEKKKRKT